MSISLPSTTVSSLCSPPRSRDHASSHLSARGTFRALRHHNYRLYFGGQIVSLTGSWVQASALTWLAYTLTASSFLPACVSTAQVVPSLLLGVWGGSLADRLPRRGLIFLAQSALLVLALLLAGMVALDLASPPALLSMALLIGVVNAIDTPARLSFIMDMVGRDDLMNAVALNSLLFNVARAVGPALGALTITWVGVAGCFLVNGVTFGAVLLALAAMRLPSPTRPIALRTPGRVGEGFGYLIRRPDLLLVVILAGAMAFFGWPILALLPALADQSLHTGYTGHAAMLCAIGVGALAGALVVATFGSAARRTLFLVTGIGVGAGALAGLSLVPSLAYALPCCALAGGGLILFFATAQATMQLGADEHNRGRIMGIWLMVLAGAQPAGNLVSGQLADRLGVSAVLPWQAAGIVVTAAGVAVAALLLRNATRSNRPSPLTPGATATAGE